MQTKQTIIDRARNSRGTFQLFDREILLAGPTVDDGEILNQQWAVDRISFHRDKLNGSLTMFDCVVSVAKCSFDHSKSAKRFPKIRLFAHDLLAFRSCGQKGVASDDCVPTLPCQKPLTPAGWKKNVLESARVT